MTEAQARLVEYLIETDLAYLHKQRWNRIAQELRDRIDGAQGEARAEAEADLAQHRSTRFHTDTSRVALLKELHEQKEMAVNRMATEHA